MTVLRGSVRQKPGSSQPAGCPGVSQSPQTWGPPKTTCGSDMATGPGLETPSKGTGYRGHGNAPENHAAANTRRSRAALILRTQCWRFPREGLSRVRW